MSLVVATGKVCETSAYEVQPDQIIKWLAGYILTWQRIFSQRGSKSRKGVSSAYNMSWLMTSTLILCQVLGRSWSLLPEIMVPVVDLIEFDLAYIATWAWHHFSEIPRTSGDSHNTGFDHIQWGVGWGQLEGFKLICGSSGYYLSCFDLICFFFVFTVFAFKCVRILSDRSEFKVTLGELYDLPWSVTWALWHARFITNYPSTLDANLSKGMNHWLWWEVASHHCL